MDIHFFNQPRTNLRFRLEETVQISALAHLLSIIETNYIRLALTGAIITEIERGARDDQFLIANQSPYIFSSEKSRAADYSSPESYSRIISSFDYIVLGSKESDPKKFWKLLGALRRPVVLFRDKETVRPIYSLDSIESLKLLDARLMSPADVGLEGLGGLLTDLIQLPGNMRRNEERHRLDQRIQAAAETQQQIKTIEDFIRVSELLENTPNNRGYKIYAQKMLDQVRSNMERQISNSRAEVSIEIPKLDLLAE